jgi:hypothetical protein
MSNDRKPDALTQRAQRLRAALRENLKRRKLQARERAASPEPEGQGGGCRPAAGGGKKDP